MTRKVSKMPSPTVNPWSNTDTDAVRSSTSSPSIHTVATGSPYESPARDPDRAQPAAAGCSDIAEPLEGAWA